MAILLPLVFGVAVSQAAVARDVKLPILSVGEFGKWYAKESGEFVVVSSQVADRDIYINVKNRTPAEVLEFVARASGLKVLRQNGAVTLQAGAGLPVEQVFRDWDKQLADIGPAEVSEADLRRAAKQFLFVQRSGGDSFSEQKALAGQQFEKFEPGRVILRQFMEGLGVAGAVQIGQGQRVVFSTRPTRLQRKWPSDSAAQISWLNEICEVKNSLVGPMNADGFRVWPRYALTNIGCIYGGAAEPVVAMRAEVVQEREYLKVDLGLFRGDGVQIARLGELFHLGSGWPPTNGSEFQKGDELTGKLTYSPAEVRETHRLNRLYGWGARNAPLDRTDLVYFAGLDRVNPLAGISTKILDFGCESTRNELVMEVAGTPLGLFEGKEFDAKYFARLFGDTRDSLLVVEPDWQLLMDRQQNLPKPAIALLARRALMQGAIRFEDIANVVRGGLDRNGVAALLRAVIGMTTPSGASGQVDANDWEVFLMMTYSQLDARGRAMARGDQGVVIMIGEVAGGISGRFQDQIGRLELWTRFADPSFGVGDMSRPGLTHRHGEPVEFDHWRAEQTEFLADQHLWPGRLALKVTGEDVLFSEWGDDWKSRPETLSRVGERLLAGRDESDRLYSLNRRERLEGSVYFADLENGGGSLSLYTTPLFRWVQLKDLPAPILDGIRRGGGAISR